MYIYIHIYPSMRACSMYTCEGASKKSTFVGLRQLLAQVFTATARPRKAPRPSAPPLWATRRSSAQASSAALRPWACGSKNRRQNGVPWQVEWTKPCGLRFDPAVEFRATPSFCWSPGRGLFWGHPCLLQRQSEGSLEGNPRTIHSQHPEGHSLLRTSKKTGVGAKTQRLTFPWIGQKK